MSNDEIADALEEVAASTIKNAEKLRAVANAVSMEGDELIGWASRFEGFSVKLGNLADHHRDAPGHDATA